MVQQSTKASAGLRRLLSGDEAVAVAARELGVSLGTGYPGTPSTEILEFFATLGGRAQWAPNEKVAMEVGVGAAFAGARALVTMKHVGLNVAADVLFTAAYTNIQGGLVVVSADDPGMASSQNEQDNRRYAVAAGVPMFEPSDSQEAYEMTAAAFDIAERWHIPVILRLTTRVCHAKTLVDTGRFTPGAPPETFVRDIPGRVMIPAYAKPAHRRLRTKLAEIAECAETCAWTRTVEGSGRIGVITSGVSYAHVREAIPDAPVLKLGMTHPVPIEAARAFAQTVDECVVIEEGDPYLEETLRAAGIAVRGKDPMYRFGELNVQRVRRIVAGDTSAEPIPPRGKPPQLCPTCPHRLVFQALSRLNCIVSGDIGCYTLGVLPPFEAMDCCVCMGASIGAGLGLRHALPEEEARRVVSVIGDSTFVHSGLTGLVEMVYNPPTTGHLVMVLDNGTTAMTGLQEHPGTGRTLSHEPTNRLDIERVAEAIGIRRIHTVDPRELGSDGLETLIAETLASGELAMIVTRRPCALIEKRVATAAAGACNE